MRGGTIESDRSTDSDRVAALQLIGREAGAGTRSIGQTAASNDEDRVATLLTNRYSPAVQSAAVSAIARLAGPNGLSRLLSRWPDATPRLRSEMLDTILSRDSWLEGLLSAVESGDVKPGDFDAVRRQRLTSHKNESIRNRAERLLAGAGTSTRRELIAAWQPVIAQQGDKDRGREAYGKRCAPCHQLDGVGFQVGPDLAALTNKSPSSLLVAVLDPNRDVDGRYVGYIAVLADGRTITGMLVNESGNSVTLREQGGKDHVLLRSDLDELRATGKSVMPEGLEKDVTQQDLADMFAYLVPPRVPPKSFPGNQPTVIRPDKHGVLPLLATAAEIYGGEIAFESESPFKNIGYWHGVGDYVGWQLQTTSAGRFDVYLDYSCDANSAGEPFRLEGAEPSLRGVVASTGEWSSYRLLRIGAVELAGGTSYLTVRYDGEKRKQALFDLRGIFLVPAGAKPPTLVAQTTVAGSPLNAAEISRRLLDDSQPAAERQKLIGEHPQQAAEIIAALVADMPRENKEEYRRIPWIWRVAVACGKRNQMDEMRAVLNVAMPLGGQPLRDWQAVVIGGGIIHGVSLAGEWPKQRIESLLKVEGILVARWQRSVELATTMADDEKVPPGTRYDALRMVAMGSWDLRGQQLRKYLAKDAHAELQMGAISGAADMPHPQAAAAILDGIPHYPERNRELALDGMLRTPERCLMLLEAVEKGSVAKGQLGDARVKKLLEHPDETVRTRAQKALAN